MNIYFIVSHPIQYFVPLYRHLAGQEGVNLHVFFLTEETMTGAQDREFGVRFTWDIPLLEGYAHTFVPNRSFRPSLYNGFWGLWNPGLVKALRSVPKGLVIVNGWQYSSYILGLYYAKKLGHRTAIRCDAPYFKELGKTSLRDRLRHFFLKEILFRKWTDSCLYIGSQNLSFYRHFGVDERRLFFSPFSIDNDRFQIDSSNDRDIRRSALDFSPEDFIILYSGKLIPVKRPMELLKAYERLDWPGKALVFVGDGELRSELEAYISEHNVRGVRFLGFVNQSDLPAEYKMADVLVMSSETDTWGLSVNEAMASGLPVVLSDGVGCGEDLVEEGRNGYIYPKGDCNALALALKKVAEAKLAGLSLGAASLEKIKVYSIERTADGILRAVMPGKLND